MFLDEKHDRALQAIIQDGNIQQEYCPMHLQKRPPEQSIASFVEYHKIDILVMSTVARTGITGFIMIINLVFFVMLETENKLRLNIIARRHIDTPSYHKEGV